MARPSKTKDETSIVDDLPQPVMQVPQPINYSIQMPKETPDRVTLALINGAAVELIQRKIYIEDVLKTAKEINDKLS